MLTPSTLNMYVYRSGLSVSVVADQTPCSSLVIGRRWPIPVTATSFAFGARSRKVTFPSAATSGDFGGAGPRPGCADKAAAVKRHKRVFIMGVYAITGAGPLAAVTGN